MISLQENKKAFKTVLFVFGISAVLLIISLVLALTQGPKEITQIAGRITTIEGSSITLSDVKGHKTTVYTTENTEIKSSNTGLVPSDFIISFGRKDSNGKFITKDIRIIRKH